MIRLRGAAFGYGNDPVVSGVDLDVSPGDFVGILGPNGSGKTTLFRGMLGLLAPMRGTVERDVAAVGYVPQREALDPVYPLSVEEVCHLGAYGRLSGLRRVSAADRELAVRALARVRIEHRRRELFSSLSGGQRQRVLIARALMMRSPVLLLDEPTTGVDQPTQRLIHDLLAELNRDENLAVLFVSHELALLRDVVKDVVWVANGSVERGEAERMLASEKLEQLFGGFASSEGKG